MYCPVLIYTSYNCYVVYFCLALLLLLYILHLLCLCCIPWLFIAPQQELQTFPCVAHDHTQHVFKYNDSEVVLNWRCSPVFVGKSLFPAGHFRELTGKGWHMARQEGGKESWKRGEGERIGFQRHRRQKQDDRNDWCVFHTGQVWHTVWDVGGFQPTPQRQGRWQRGGSGGSISLLS